MAETKVVLFEGGSRGGQRHPEELPLKWEIFVYDELPVVPNPLPPGSSPRPHRLTAERYVLEERGSEPIYKYTDRVTR